MYYVYYLRNLDIYYSKKNIIFLCTISNRTEEKYISYMNTNIEYMKEKCYSVAEQYSA